MTKRTVETLSMLTEAKPFMRSGLAFIMHLTRPRGVDGKLLSVDECYATVDTFMRHLVDDVKAEAKAGGTE
jgi:hypothetical protein